MTTTPPPAPADPSPSSPPSVLAQALDHARLRARLSPEELAAKLQVPVEEVLAREAGERTITDATLRDHATMLGTTPRRLVLQEVAPDVLAAHPPDDDLPDLNERLLPLVVRRTAERLGYAQVTLANVVGVAASTVNRWASGAYDIGEDVILRLAEGLESSDRLVIREALLYEVEDVAKVRAPLVAAFTLWTRARYHAAIEGKLTTGGALAKTLGVNRSSISRFGAGTDYSPGFAFRLHQALDLHAPLDRALGVTSGGSTLPPGGELGSEEPETPDPTKAD